MTTNEQNWREIGDLLSGLASKLKTQVTEASSGNRDELRSAVDKLTKAVDDTFHAVRDLAVDDDVRADVREVGQRLGETLSATVTQLGESLRPRREGPAAGDGDGSGTPPAS